jgi:hypothetical protein
VHALNASGGEVLWDGKGAQSFGATTVAGGTTFDGLALRNVAQVRDAAHGTLLVELSLPAPCWSGIATIGDAVVLGTGASHVGASDGLVVFTPDGRPPIVPVS